MDLADALVSAADPFFHGGAFGEPDGAPGEFEGAVVAVGELTISLLPINSALGWL